MSAASASLSLDPERRASGGVAPEQRFGDSHALVKGLLARDEAAAVALFEEYAGLVERTIARILGPDTELSDAVQEAFLSALNSMPKLRDPQALPQWMR